MRTRRSSRKPEGDHAIVLRMCWSCTDREVAAFTGLSRKTVERIREKLGIRKYHKWTGKDFALVRSAKRMMHPVTTALPVLGVSPKALYNAVSRNQHLAA